jgi:RNA polymerase sigma-70 factor (ECF subfamily)
MRPLSFHSSNQLPFAAAHALLSFDGRGYVGLGGQAHPQLRFAVRTSPFAHTSNVSGLTSNDDIGLIAAMARGDERAAAQLYDKYSAPLFALAVRIVGESADAEDVVLDTFTQAWNSSPRYEAGRGSVLGWLITIARTRALDLVRGRGRRSKAVDTASRSMGDEPVGVAGHTVSAADSVELAERATAVNSALNVLSGSQRSCIELAFYEGLTHSEIAERLGEPLGTIKTRIRLGMQKLRDVLQDLPPSMVS